MDKEQSTTLSDFRKNDQLAALGELTCTTVTDAVYYLVDLTDKLKELKKTANFISWKLQESQNVTKLKTIPYECPNTNAKGFSIPGIDEVYYDLEQASKFLQITTQHLAERATCGTVYCVQIGQGTYFPKGALVVQNG